MRSRSARACLGLLCLDLFAMLAGCGEGPGQDQPAPPPATSTAPANQPGSTSQPVARASLENTHWRLVQVAGHPPVVTPADRAEAYFVLMSDGRQMQGFGGCNRMGGPYETDGQALKFGPVHATRMACSDPRNPEDAFMKALEATAGVRITGAELELFDATGASLATFQARLNPAG